MDPKTQNQKGVITLTADDMIQCILDYLKCMPPLTNAAYFFHDQNVTRPEAFSQCFGSRTRVTRLVQESPHDDYVLLIMAYSTADPIYMRPVFQKRIPVTYLYLEPDFKKMVETKDVQVRQRLALQNLYKIELMQAAMIKRYKIEMHPKVILRLLCLMPADLKANNHIQLFNELVMSVSYSQKLLQLEDVFDAVRADFPGSGAMGPVLSKLSITANAIAESLIQYCQQKAVDLSKMFIILTRHYKTIKTYDVIYEVSMKLSVKMMTGVIQQLIVNFVKKIMLKDLARDIFFPEGDKIIKALLSNPKIMVNGTITLQQFNALMTTLNNNRLVEHLKLLLLIASRCLPHNHIDEQVAFINKRLQALVGPQKPNQMGHGTASSKDLLVGFNAFGGSNSLLEKPMTAIVAKTQKDIYSAHSFRDINKLNNNLFKTSGDIPSTPNVCLEYIGLPNIGNSCYINGFIQSLFFCRKFLKTFYDITPKDVSLQYLRNLLIYLYNQNKQQLTKTIKEFKKTLSEDFNNDQQQDSMEFGRMILDKMESQQKLKKLFQISIEETIMCPKGDIIQKRVVKQMFMMLSFEDPKLFSKLQSRIGGEIELNSMIIRDYYTPTIIQSDFECSVCKCKYNKREKRQKIVSMPSILIVVLSRFTYDLTRNAKRKICDRVKIDNWLLFGKSIQQNQADNFQLVSMINHMGKNAQSGHYQCYARYPKKEGKWLNFDDDFVTEAYHGKVTELVRNLNQFDSPYVLFYERSG